MSESDRLAAIQELLKQPGGMKSLHEIGRRGRKPIDLPTIPAPGGGNLARYAIEKLTGLRRENGAMKLKRLTHRHYRIIGLHLEGNSLEQISSSMHITFTTISRVLNDPLAQSILKRVYGHREEEIEALTGKAIDATRSAITGDHPIGMKLRGVDRLIKIREVMLSKDKGRESAEDVIARMLRGATFINSQVQINAGVTSNETVD